MLKKMKAVLGKVIKKVSLEDNKLVFKFTDGTGLNLFDNGQLCCEDRYMKTDDDLSYYGGATLLDFELKDGPDIDAKYGIHEVQFLDVKTSVGTFQVANHNEHNGYYSGLCIAAK